MHEPTTIAQLDEWMTANCYPDSYAIADRIIHEGYGLAMKDNTWHWYYTERGVVDYLKPFASEREAVAFAFPIIRDDTDGKRHLLGFVKDIASEKRLIQELSDRNIFFQKDTIPYGGSTDPRTRIFVFGCDINEVQDLVEKWF
jgi:hypothetical protein